MRSSVFEKKVRNILDSRDQQRIHSLLAGMESVECESLVDADLFHLFVQDKYEEVLDFFVRKGLVNRRVVEEAWKPVMARYPDQLPAWDWEDVVIGIFRESFPLVPKDCDPFIVPYLCSHWLAEHPEDLDPEDCTAFMGSEDYQDALDYRETWGNPEDLDSWRYVHYRVGDATKPIETGVHKQVIAHCCNDIGAWGAGFVLAVNQLSPIPKMRYMKWVKDPSIPVSLGMVQVVGINERLAVANMIGQHGIAAKDGEPPIRYRALETALNKLCEYMANKISTETYDIHMPRIGCGLAGGNWERVEEILLRVAKKHAVHFYVYDLKRSD